MTAVISSSEVDSNAVVTSDLTMISSQQLHSGKSSSTTSTWVSSQETTATMDPIDEQDHDKQYFPAVTPQPKESKGFAPASPSESSVCYEIPRCEMPPPSEMDTIEKFVVNAIRSQEPNLESGDADAPDTSHMEGYQAIITSFKRPNDPRLLRKLMIALRTAGSGSVLNQVALGSCHAQLVHLIIRFNPMRPPHNYEDIFTGDHEELLQVYEDYSMCDAHFHLLLAMVSAKSTHVLPILSAMWKLLTRFGPVEDEKM
jgi:hypothetical protein